ncbi:methyl-accepting chemotaxis protein [Sporomusa sp. KB1]|jgi:methyl-accepting chemotaxis protein|uniref:methyl-accepting chemotaxis protein n=1 Tax=Sporomusa sp. KB1 TaxID=943346 RepID=UPI00119D626B|nr:methyl-accepting chemotaxis protein [Sporomusa sp. KB1]TWH45652.1 methyl-accepting chemotaxis protein [Sporomusa sp. KB1]
MKSIKVKLLVAIITLFVVTLAALAGLNYWQAKKILTKDIEVEITNLVQNSGKEIGMWLSGTVTEMATIARSPLAVSGNREGIAPYLGAELARNKMYENILWIDSTGNYFDSKGETGNLADRDYFKQGIKGETVISDPVMSKGTGKLIVVIAVPIQANGRIIGVLAGPVNIEEVEKKVLGIKVGKTGYAFLLRKDGLTIIHPNKEIANKTNVLTDSNANPALKAAEEKMVQGESGLASYNYDGSSKYLAYAPIAGTSWSIGVNVPASEVTGKLDAFTWVSIGTIMVVLIIASLAILMIASRISKPLQTLEAAANGIAAGDLRMAEINVNSQDELGHLARAFETMTGNLHNLVRQIGSTSEQVAASSEELTANADQSAQAASQVAGSIVETAQGAARQTSAVTKAVDFMQQITSEARQQADKTRNAVNIASRAVNSAAEGNKAVTTAVSQMNSIKQTVDNSAQVVVELGERSKEIGQIVETIAGIASQTNLLALNAAIEAARAGEQGRGFAVVAEEVRKLAEQSQEAAKKIAELISDIQGKTENAVTAMTNGTQEVKRGYEVVDQAGIAFRDINGHVKEVADIAQDAANGMDELAFNSEKVLETVKEVETISREIASQAQTVSAATEEQSASMEEIASSSQNLAELAEQLQNVVSRFKV